MSIWSFGTIIVVAMSIGGGLVRAQDYLYRDDDLLCRPGWSPDLYYDRVQAYESQQRMSQADYQSAMAYQAAVEQKSQERIRNARRAKSEKEARRREDLLGKRKADRAVIRVTKTTSATATAKPLIESKKVSAK